MEQIDNRINFLTILDNRINEKDDPSIMEIKIKIHKALEMEKSGGNLAEIAAETELSEAEIAYIVMMGKKIEKARAIAKEAKTLKEIKKATGLDEEEIICVIIGENSASLDHIQ